MRIALPKEFFCLLVDDSSHKLFAVAGFVVGIIVKPPMSLGGINWLFNADISCQLMKCNSKTSIVFAVNQALCVRRKNLRKECV